MIVEFIYIALAHFVALLSPGPDFFLILQASLRLSRRCGFAIALGIASANGLFVLLTILGLESFRGMGQILIFLKYLGAGYLLFIGYSLLRSKGSGDDGADNQTNFVNNSKILTQFYLGFLSGIMNPKNIIFYFSLFTVMISPDTSLPIRSLYGLWMFMVVLVWDCLLVIFLGQPRIKNKIGSGTAIISKISGSVLIFMGCYLGLS